jgi:hypothetical protein
LAQPRAALAQAYPELPVPDRRLTPQGQQLSRLLRLLSGVGPRLLRLLPPTEADCKLLSSHIKEASRAVCQLAKSLGPLESAGSEEANAAVVAPNLS